MDDAFVNSVKRGVGDSKWSEFGCVTLPYKNRITKLVVDVDDGKLLDEICSLNLKANAVSDVEGAERLVPVEELDCGKSGFCELPEWIERLPTLRKLNAWGNCLTVLPEWIVEKESLQEVCASQNERMTKMVVCPNLTALDLSFCDIQFLPDDIFQYSLRMVFLASNKGRT